MQLLNLQVTVYLLKNLKKYRTESRYNENVHCPGTELICKCPCKIKSISLLNNTTRENSRRGPNCKAGLEVFRNRELK